MKNKIGFILLVLLLGVVLFVAGFFFYKFVGFSVFYKKGKSIERLDHRELGFKELPNELQRGLIDISNNKRNKENGSLMILDEAKEYKLEVVETGPWTDYFLLKDLSTEKQYRIPREAADPYIIYKNKLYIPREYNIVGTNTKAIYTVLYDEYILK